MFLFDSRHDALKRLSLYMSKVADQAGAYLRFQLHEATTGVLYSPLDRMLVHLTVSPRIKVAGKNYTAVEIGNVRVKCLS